MLYSSDHLVVGKTRVSSVAPRPLSIMVTLPLDLIVLIAEWLDDYYLRSMRVMLKIVCV
jgi:hypothetical protein